MSLCGASSEKSRRGLPRRATPVRWTVDECKALVEYVGAYPSVEAVNWNAVLGLLRDRGFPSRTLSAIKSKNRQLRKEKVSTDAELDSGGGRSTSGKESRPEGEPNSGVIRADAALAELAEEDSLETTDGNPTETCNEPDNTLLDAQNLRGLFYKVWRRLAKSSPTKNRIPLKSLYGVDRARLNRLVLEADKLLTETLERRRGKQWSWTQLNRTVYSAATAVTTLLIEGKKESAKHAHELRMEKEEKIRSVRDMIGYLSDELRRRRSNKPPTKSQKRNFWRIVELYGKRMSNRRLVEIRTELAESLRELNYQLERMTADHHRKEVRMAATSGGKKRALAGEAEMDWSGVRKYWSKLFGEERKFRMIPELDKFAKDVKTMQDTLGTQPGSMSELTQEAVGEIVGNVLCQMRPWKAAGPDKIQAYWWKSLPAARDGLISLVYRGLKGSSRFPKWVPTGRVCLIPKVQVPKESDFRPIALLNTCWKVYTAVLARLLTDTYSVNTVLFPEEQKAVRKGKIGCTEAHMIDRAVRIDAQYRKSSRRSALIEGWVDFAKAFDSISHDYIRWFLERLEIPSNIRGIIATAMKAYKVELTVNGKVLGSTRVRAGVYQGDSLSPLMFCMCVAPISHALNRVADPYVSETQTNGSSFRVGHLYYVDDLKVFTTSVAGMERALETVQEVGQAIGLWINPAKSAFHIARSDERPPSTIAGVPRLEDEDGYSYLGALQGGEASDRRLMTRIAQRLSEATEKVFATGDLTIGQYIRRINCEVVPKAEYLFRNIALGKKADGALALARRLDIALRKKLVSKKARYAHAPVDRWYLKRENGGYGLRSMEEAYITSVIGAYAYLQTEPQLAQFRRVHEKFARRGKRTLRSEVDTLLTSRIMTPILFGDDGTVTIAGTRLSSRQNVMKVLKRKLQEELSEQRKREFLSHCKNTCLREDNLILPWVKELGVSCENARLGMAIDEVNLFTVCGITDRKCVSCHADGESVQHVLNNCPAYLHSFIMLRHDAVARVVYEALCRLYGLETVPYFVGPPAEVKNGRAAIWWDRLVKTRSAIFHRKPDIVLLKRENGLVRKVTIIEVAVAWRSGIESQAELKRQRYTVNGVRQEDSRVLPYESGPNLAVDLEQQFGCPVNFVPVVIGSGGEILPDLLKPLRMTLGMDGRQFDVVVERLSRAAMLGSARLLKVHLARVQLPDVLEECPLL